MTNPIKHNTITESLALKKGNFWIGTKDVAKGPTSATGFYAGISPPVGGYSIYINKASGGPAVYCPSNDSELIEVTNQIANANYITVNQCLSYFATQNDMVVLNRNYERIVTNGLILHLDPSYTASYPRNGTICYDLSGGSNNGTLVNGVSYVTGSGDIGGTFRLDGTNDRIDVPKTLNGFTYNIHYDINWTIECWMYTFQPDAFPQNYKMIYGNYSGCNYSVYPGNGTGFIIYSANSSANVYATFGFGPKSPSGCPDEITWNTSETAWFYDLAVGKWCHFALTSDDGTSYRLYVNGVQRGATKSFNFKNASSRTANNLQATTNYSWGGDFTGNAANQVDFSAMRIYNRPLSQAEITQNFEASRSRFNI